MEQTLQLRKSIRTILWSVPAMLLGYPWLRLDLDILYINLGEPNWFWEPLDSLVSHLPIFQWLLLITVFILLAIGIARQPNISHFHPLKYLPLLMMVSLGCGILFSEIEYASYGMCKGCDLIGWLSIFSFLLFLISNLITLLVVAKSQISDVFIRTSFLILIPVILGVGVEVISLLSLGIRVWANIQSDSAAFLRMNRLHPNYFGDPNTLLLLGLLMSVLGLIAFWSGIRVIMSLKKPTLLENG